MRLDYVLKRFAICILMIWLAATLNFFLPRLSNINPIQTKLIQLSISQGAMQWGAQEMIKDYEQKFGLDKPLWQQYLTYMVDMSQLNMNYSISYYPRTVVSMMRDALPWTIGLLSVTTMIAFLVGNFIGALLAWPSAPKFISNVLFPPLLTLSAIPYYLLGLVLLYLFSFQIKIFPIFGGYTAGTLPDWGNVLFWSDIARHAFLPALSIVLAGIGFWALGMRAMVVTTEGEDFMIFAEARGLLGKTLFLQYAVRNAMLPQTTALALSLGHIVSGAILVEVVFSYPGIGTVLYHAIRESDYFLVQGIIMGVIISISLATFLLDLIYPIIDPRITYGRA